MADGSGAWVALKSAALTAAVDPLGAQLSLLRDAAGRDLLWNGDPAWWTGRAPVLFPIVGSLAQGRYRSGGREYALPRHGFARNRPFTVADSGAAGAVFRLESDADTLAVYPFAFTLELRFFLQGPTLVVAARVINRGPDFLPASLGFHPAFRWPLPYGAPRAAHGLQFECGEPAPIRRLDGRGLLDAERHPTPVDGGRLPLADGLFSADALIFDALRSRTLSYGAAGHPQLQLTFPDAEYLGLWSKPGAPFVCIEPWRGVADPAGFTGDLRDKPGIFLVPPEGSASLTMVITLLA